MAAAPETPVAADPAAFEAALDEFFAAIRRARARATRVQPDGLSLSQLNLLRPLAEGGARPVGELAELADVAAPTATRMLDCLERDGLVARAHATHDRRVVTVELTDEGARVLGAKLDAVLTRRRELFAGLDEDDRARAADLLQRLAEMVDRL
jgi:MarR family transcriptional regulator, organic hydroperoxide resistance regulator